MHKLAIIKNVFCETMQRKTYVTRICVLLFLIIEDANVNALSLTSCDDPLENEVCNLTCTTADHSKDVAFYKGGDPATVAQCVAGDKCYVPDQYSISQPNSFTTVLSFIHSRNSPSTWKCFYDGTLTSVSVPWATYPQTVSTTLTSNTTVDTNIDGNVTLGCLYSEQAPTVTLQYEDANGNNDAISAETFQCDVTDISCTDGNFTTYGCPVVVKEENGIDNSDTYSIKLKIKVSHVQTEDVHTIVTDITFTLPVTTVTITPAGENNVVYIIEGEKQTFTCTTNYSRPAAWIQWYIGGQNVTNQATPQPPQRDGDKFISSSSLMYTGKDVDHNKSISCQAVNIEGRQKVNSTEKSLYIPVLVTTVTITPAGDNNVVDIIEGDKQTFTCTTNYSRPAAWIQWYIGGQNVKNQATSQERQEDVDKFRASSSLVYTGRDADHNKVISCQAVNIEGRQKVNSTEKSLYIQYGPKEITLRPDTKSYTVSEMGSINTISCSADCRPDCTFVWKGPNMFETHQFNLTFEFVLRNQSGIYVCYVSNYINSSMSQSISFIVNYKPSNLRLEIHESNTVNESESAVFQCNIDSNPASNITWTSTISGEVLQTDHSVLQSSYTVNSAKCTQTGTYMCQATNTFTGEMGMAYKTINFYVLCSTRTDDPMDEIPTTIGVTNEEGLNITVVLIAYPKPVIQWMLTSDIINTTIDSTDNTFNVFEHVSNVYKTNMILTDFGNYTVFAFNEIGETYKKTFIVIPQKVLDDTDTPSALIGGVVGSVSGILIIILIVVVVFFIRRHNNKGDNKEPIERNVPHEDDEDDGLKDNPFCITPPASSNVDSSAHNNGQGYIYSQVDRTNKTGNKEGKGKNLAKTGKMEQKHKDIELDVYENPDEVLNDIQAESVYANSDTNNKMTENDQNKKQKKNKYGLAYADLDLAPGPGGSRFVIRGIENRTNYAIIDPTKTATPLPSDDDEDEKHENTVSANRNEP